MRRRGVALGALVVALTVLVAGAAQAERGILENLEISVSGRVEPFRLPRDGSAPISVFIAGHLSTTNGTTPPQLQRMTIQLNRHGSLNDSGLPVCRISQIQPSSTEHALSACRNSLIGAGQFWAEIVLPGQAPYPTEGRLLAFNGRQGSSPVVLVHIFTDNPFFNSFVITFAIHNIPHGNYGTELSASLPEALGTWGYVNRIKMTLSRKYAYHGRALSYFNANCPAPKGVKTAVFQLARANFFFTGEKELSVTLNRPCAVK